MKQAIPIDLSRHPHNKRLRADYHIGRGDDEMYERAFTSGQIKGTLRVVGAEGGGGGKGDEDGCPVGLKVVALRSLTLLYLHLRRVSSCTPTVV